METIIGSPNSVYLAIFAMVALVLALWSSLQMRRALKSFQIDEDERAAVWGTSAMPQPDSINRPYRVGKRFVSAVLVSTTIALLAVALMDVRWGKVERKIEQRGIDVVFALDVSRSMLANDVVPSRLDRAKQQIADLLEVMPGDRIALVAFAGEARQVVPLTKHHNDFMQALDSIDTNTVGSGGSKLGSAIQESMKCFVDDVPGHKAIVLITDGEDMESEPVKAAENAHDTNGVKIFTVGLGDIAGAFVPSRDTNEFMRYEGELVKSKLNGGVLQKIADVTDAQYIPAGTKYVDLGAVYRSYIANIETRSFDDVTVQSYEARFQWFAIPAFVLLVIESLLVRFN